MSENGWTARLQRFVESSGFTATVVAVVVLNAGVLGLATSHTMSARSHAALTLIDHGCLAFFVAEMGLKLAAFRGRFFRNAWSVFDLAVVTVSLAPAAGPFSVLRVLRVLRMLRVVSVIRPLRRVVEALIRAVPGIGAILGVLAVFIYIGAVLTTTLYGDAHPELFGTLGESVISLFQVMLFDGWAGEIVRVVEETDPGSSIFFIGFTVLTGFAVLNLFIAVMVDALRDEHDRLQNSELERIEDRQRGTQAEIDELEQAVKSLEVKIDRVLAHIDAAARGGEEEDGG